MSVKKKRIRKPAKKEFVVYKITNTVNDKIYIGYSTNYIKRWASHKNIAKNSKGYYLHNAIKYYGAENFTFEILNKYKNKKLMKAGEIYFIKKFNSTNKKVGYNILLGDKVVNKKDHNTRKIPQVRERKKRNKSHSEYTGVTFNFSRKKWYAKFSIKEKTYNLGTFLTEIKAAESVNNFLKNNDIKDNDGNLLQNNIKYDNCNILDGLAEKYKNRPNKKERGNYKTSSSKYFGVRWSKKYLKWLVSINHLGTVIYLGRFDCEISAAEKANEFLKDKNIKDNNGNLLQNIIKTEE